MRQHVQSRLVELRGDYQVGQSRLAELDRERQALRETLLRINGAMQVLEELLAPPAGEDRKNPDGAPEAVRVP